MTEWMEQAKAKLKLQLDTQDIGDGRTIHMPPNPWKYTVEFTADNPRYMEGYDRWRWLCDNIGPFREAWDLIPAYSPEENTVYVFKTEDAAVRFKLTWL